MFRPIILVSVPMHRALQFASLEKYLLENKRRPRECVQEVTEWCDAVQLKAVATGSSYFGSIRIRKERKARALD